MTDRFAVQGEPEWVYKLPNHKKDWIRSQLRALEQARQQVAMLSQNTDAANLAYTEIVVHAPGTYSAADGIPMPNGSKVTFQVGGLHGITMYVDGQEVVVHTERQLVVLPGGGINTVRLLSQPQPNFRRDT